MVIVRAVILYISYRTVPLCDGRPGGLCPSHHNNSSVRHSQGDLMLCPSYIGFCFPPAKPLLPANNVNSSAGTVGAVAAAATITVTDYPPVM